MEEAGGFLRQWLQAKLWDSNWAREKIVKAELHRRFVSVLAEIPTERLIRPVDKAAIPLLEEVILRDPADPVQTIAQTLLAKAFDGALVDQIHPGFAGILSELASEEAEIFIEAAKCNSDKFCFTFNHGMPRTPIYIPEYRALLLEAVTECFGEKMVNELFEISARGASLLCASARYTSADIVRYPPQNQ